MFDLDFLLAAIPSAQLVQRAQPQRFTGVTTDSRTAAEGHVFFPIRAARDGHEFIRDAIDAGCTAVVIEHGIGTVPSHVSIIQVRDTLAALQQFGAHCRASHDSTCIAITGSAGKTTTKDMIATVLRSRYAVVASRKSFNNHLGVPLTLAEIDRNADYAVVEIGTNHPGEVAALAELAHPDIAVVTNVGYAHIGNFGSREALTAEKTSLLSAVGSGGLRIINGDDRNLAAFADKRRGEGVCSVRVGLRPGNDITAEDITIDGSGTFGVVKIGGRFLPFRLRTAGVHFVRAFLLALAVAQHCGISAETVIEDLSTFEPTGGRGGILTLRAGLHLIDDTYNASPDSVFAALESLAAFPDPMKIAVLGEMRELGTFAGDLYKRVAACAARCATHVVLVGGARAQTSAFRAAGLASERLLEAACATDSISPVRTILSQGPGSAAILAKAARLSHLERLPLLLGGHSVTCRLQTCSLYINCADCSLLNIRDPHPTPHTVLETRAIGENEG